MLLHGTAAQHGPSIVVRGIVETFLGRGVLLTAQPGMAFGASWFAALGLHAESEEHRAIDTDGLICHVNVEGMDAVRVPAGTPGWSLSHAGDIYVVPSVPRWRIARFERIGFVLPEAGSVDERWALRMRAGRRIPDVVPLREKAQRLVEDGLAERVVLDDERHRASCTMEEYLTRFTEQQEPDRSDPLAGPWALRDGHRHNPVALAARGVVSEMLANLKYGRLAER